MNNGISLIRYIFGKFISLLFDDFTIVTNVSIGWVMVSIVIISIMISNILSLAKNSINMHNSTDRQLRRENMIAQTRWYNNHMGD